MLNILKSQPKFATAYRKRRHWLYRLAVEESRLVEMPNTLPVGPLAEEEFYSIQVLNRQVVKITVKKGYCWDGPSGLPKIFHLPRFIASSLPHDVFYQAMREGFLCRSYRKPVDLDFLNYSKRKGVILAYPAYWLVRLFGRKHTKDDRIYG